MFSLQNGTGGPSDVAGGHHNEAFTCKGVFSEVKLNDQKSRSSTPVVQKKVVFSDDSPERCPKTRAQNESCILHDVTGVLLHHSHPNNDFTMAIAAKQISEVKYYL